jgi:hypothetical protein
VIFATADEFLERRLDELRQLIASHAVAKREQTYLEHYRQIKLATLMKQAERDGVSAANAQEREARAHPEYERVIRGLSEAVERETETRWALVLAQWQFEATRSRMASERVERQRYGG